MRAALIAAGAGEFDFVRRIVRKWSRSYPRPEGGWRRNPLLPPDFMQMLMEHDPSAVIRLVHRATRAPWVRSDERTEDERRSYLAKAHELLGRPARARRLRAAEAQRGLANR